MSDSVPPQRQQPTRLPRPWDSPGKNTGVGCHFLLQCMKVESESEVAQSCPTLSNPMDCSPPGSSVHGILQARIPEWVAIPFSRESCFCWLYRASPSGCKENNQSDFGIDHLVMSTYRVFSYVIGRTCLLWSVHSLGKTLLAFALLHSVLQGQICLLFQVFLTSYFCIPVPFNEMDIFFGVLEDLVCLHRTVQLQLLQHYCSGHWLGLLCYWMAGSGNEQSSFCCFWDCIQVLHFGLICWPWWLLHFF